MNIDYKENIKCTNKENKAQNALVYKKNTRFHEGDKRMNFGNERQERKFKVNIWKRKKN